MERESLFSPRERVAVLLMIGATALVGLLDWFWCDWLYPGFLFGLIAGLIVSRKGREDPASGLAATPTQSGVSPEGNEGGTDAGMTSQEAWGTNEDGIVGSGYTR